MSEKQCAQEGRGLPKRREEHVDRLVIRKKALEENGVLQDGLLSLPVLIQLAKERPVDP